MYTQYYMAAVIASTINTYHAFINKQKLFRMYLRLVNKHLMSNI